MGWRAWARGRAAKVALAALCALAVVELAWLIVANVALGFQLPARLVGQSANTKLGYARAWSLYPGDLRVRGLWLHVESSDHRIDVDVEHAHAGVDLLALPKRRFRTRWLEGNGVVVRVHEEKHALHAVEAGASPGHWSAQLDEVELRQVRELRLGWAHVHGMGRIRGRAFLSANRIDVGPVAFDLGTGQVQVANQLLADWVGVHGRITISPFDPRSVKGGAIFERISGRADVRANVAGLEALDSAMPWLNARGLGDVQASVVVSHGVLAHGTTAQLRLHDARMTLGPATFAGALEGQLSVKDTRETLAEVQLERLAISIRDQPSVRVHDGAIDLTAHFPAPTLRGPLPPARASLRVRDVRLELAALSALLPPQLEIRLGEATLDGSFELGRRTEGQLHLMTNELVPALAGHAMRADLEADVNVQAVSLEPLALDLGGTSLELHTGSAAGLDGLLGWWMQGKLDRATLELEPHVRGSMSASLVERDGLPWLSVLRLAGKVPSGWAHALNQPGLLIELDAQSGDRQLTLSSLRARGPQLSLEGGLRVAESVDGAFKLSNDAPVGIAIRQGALEFVDRPDRAWLKSQLDVLATSQLRTPPVHRATGRRSARR
ncbi:MAG: hypothetical protein JST54_17615 [Deltaproteobacteria bacterium]|nr:hypothetical protein [Deltaproteobacteria bacterium]